jgi:Lipocalin-like domain
MRDHLIAAWELVSYVEKPLNGSLLNYPMGESPMGIIMYTPDGYMSATLLGQRRCAETSEGATSSTGEDCYGKELIRAIGIFALGRMNETVAVSDS